MRSTSFTILLLALLGCAALTMAYHHRHHGHHHSEEYDNDNYDGDYNDYESEHHHHHHHHHSRRHHLSQEEKEETADKEASDEAMKEMDREEKHHDAPKKKKKDACPGSIEELLDFRVPHITNQSIIRSVLRDQAVANGQVNEAVLQKAFKYEKNGEKRDEALFKGLMAEIEGTNEFSVGCVARILAFNHLKDKANREEFLVKMRNLIPGSRQVKIPEGGAVDKAIKIQANFERHRALPTLQFILWAKNVAKKLTPVKAAQEFVDKVNLFRRAAREVVPAFWTAYNHALAKDPNFDQNLCLVRYNLREIAYAIRRMARIMNERGKILKRYKEACKHAEHQLNSAVGKSLPDTLKALDKKYLERCESLIPEVKAALD